MSAFAASLLQERQLRTSHGGLFYDNTTLVWRMPAPATCERVLRAIQVVVAQHDVLRTRLEHDGQDVIQIVCSEAAVAATVIAGDAADRRWRRFMTSVRANVREPFDLTQVPVPRATVTSIAGETYVGLVLSHVSCDAWSVDLLLEHIAIVSLGAERQPVMAGLRFADYALEERRSDWSWQLRFWRRQLAGADLQLALPGDRSRPRSGNHRAVLPIQLASPNLVHALSRIGRERRVTLPMIFHAAVGLAAMAAARRNDIVLATYDANRADRRWHDVVGCLLNVLLVRIAAPPTSHLGDLLDRTRDAMLDAWENRVPFDLLEATLARHAERHDLDYDLCVNWIAASHARRGGSHIDDLKPVLRAPRPERVWYPHRDWHGGTITFLAGLANDGGVAGSLFYESRLRDASAMRDLVERVQTALVLIAGGKLDVALGEIVAAPEDADERRRSRQMAATGQPDTN